ncbi:MAG: tRNA pseudouridine(55) synthase TruB [Terriglobales bacterium]
MNGVLILDKPAGLTSHDVVNRVRRMLHERSVGHLGTLDPLATGVLPLVIGNLTRLAQFYTSSEKTYEGTIRFGFATGTYDADGEPTSPAQEVAVSLDQLRQLARRFRGIIEQTPPPFSAKKIQGVPAYKLARKHAEVALKPVQVEVKEFEILGVDTHAGPNAPVQAGEQISAGFVASFRAHVASGTYMRSIAHDMGQRIGCGAHLASLRRTAVGEFDLADAHTLQELDAAVKAGKAEEMFIHPRKLLPQFPCVTANEETAARIRTGRPVNLPELSQSRMVKVFAGQRELIAIATRVAGTLFHAKIVLAAESGRVIA